MSATPNDRNASIDRLLGRSPEPEQIDLPPWADDDAYKREGEGPQLQSLADVQPVPVDWLWPGRLPLGKLVVLSGDPGTGKSFLTADLAARVSTGRAWPDGEPCRKGAVLFMSAEDGLADTLRPRLDASGADVRHVSALDMVRRVAGDEAQPFTLADDDMLERAFRDVRGCKLAFIDPISSFFPARTDTNSQSELRGILRPVAAAAERTGVCVVMVSHLNKSQGAKSIYRVSGSLALIAAARCGWMVVADRDDEERRLFLPTKNNLAPFRGGLAYRVTTGKTPRIEWEEQAVMLTADDAMEARGGPDPIAEACAWLEGELAGGAMVDASHLLELAKAAGISERTLRRAKEAIGVKATRNGFGPGGGWQWSLPKADA